MHDTSPPYTIQDFLETKSAMGPSFSASGRKIAYIANVTGTFQAYVAAVLHADREQAEPRQVTDFEDAVGFVEFSPVDDDLLIFGKDERGNERHQLYLLNLKTDETQALTSEPSAMHRWGGWSRDGGRIAFASYKRNGADHDIYVLDIATMSEKMVFDLGGWCECFGFSPSGRWLIVSKAKSGGFMDTELYLVDSDGHEPPKLLTPHEEKAYFAEAEWLPDESKFWTLTDRGVDNIGARQKWLETPTKKIALGYQFQNRSFEEIRLTKDGAVLGMVVNVDGYSRVFEINPPEMLKARRELALPKGQSIGLTWSHDGARAAVAVSTPESSYNVWVWEKSESKAYPITRIPMGVPPDVPVRPELIKYRSFDDLEVPAFLFLPRASSSAPIPAVVHIHGGPEGQFRPAFNPIIQYLAYRGYAVIAPNVRGSDGYGKKYLSLDDRFKRLDSVRDLEALHQWIEKDGRIDPKRVALMGGSYGGYMVLAGLAFQAELWAAGVDIVGIASLVTFLENTSSYRRSVRESEYGYLATDREFLESVSPLNKAGDIRAPLFIIHGANDPRVPVSEAYQIRDKLAARGVPVQLLIYDDEGHGLSKLKNRLDAYPKAAEFLDATIGPASAGQSVNPPPQIPAVSFVGPESRAVTHRDKLQKG